MCFAALAASKLRDLEREFAAFIDAAEFAEKFWLRVNDPKSGVRFPVDIDRAFLQPPRNDAEASAKEAIEAYRRLKVPEWEAEIFQQRKRFADAERALAMKVTKKAQTDLRVSQNKISQRMRWLDDIRGTNPKDEDSVVYAMNYAPVIVQTDAGRLIRPMRYHCRLAGKPRTIDAKLPGLYNARIDSLEDWWSPVFGKQHALFVITGFRENVKKHDMEGRGLAAGEDPENVVLQFVPRGGGRMLVPCVWSRWTDGKEVLDSFALITDEPPREVAAAGHDRCPIYLTREAAEAWLSPEGRSRAELFEILAQRQRPFYEHRIAEAA